MDWLRLQQVIFCSSVKCWIEGTLKIPFFQVVSQILYKTEVCRGRFQLWASSQGLPVQLAPADPVKSTIFKSPTSATGFNPKVTTLHNFGEKFKAICLVLSNIVYFCHSGSILVSSCLVPQMDTKLKHIPAFRSPLQNVIELFKED